MFEGKTGTPSLTAEIPFRQVFGVALGFLVVVAALGALLRLQGVWPIPQVNYGQVLHAHSHIAFLGWVFNAFFALALVTFTPACEVRRYLRLFFVLQCAVVGMLASYPFQGYGWASISFSTLHMLGAAAFAWMLWRRNLALPSALGHLRVALAFFVVSGVGPLALGPLAALGLRESAAYQLSIYFYLHCQYNGWFLFFLQAVLLQALARRGLRDHDRAARQALRWLLVGAILTLAQSALWLDPPGWVYGLAGVGGIVQLVGCVHLVRAVRAARELFAGSARWLALLALGGFLLKHGLQAIAALPGLGGWVNHRLTVMAFLHLVFLGVVAPTLLAWALHIGWLREGKLTRVGLAIFVGSSLASELLLTAAPLAGFYSSRLLLAAALGLLAGSLTLLASLFSRTSRPGE